MKVAELSRYELAVAKSLLAFNKLDYQFEDLLRSAFESCLRGTSGRVPRQYSQKIDALMKLYEFEPRMRSIGLTDGTLPINAIGYAMDEIYFVRNEIAHGYHFASNDAQGFVELTFLRIVTNKNSKSGLDKKTFKISGNKLERLHWYASWLSTYFLYLKDVLQGKKDPDFLNEGAKRQGENRDNWDDWWVHTKDSISNREYELMRLICNL